MLAAYSAILIKESKTFLIDFSLKIAAKVNRGIEAETFFLFFFSFFFVFVFPLQERAGIRSIFCENIFPSLCLHSINSADRCCLPFAKSERASSNASPDQTSLAEVCDWFDFSSPKATVSAYHVPFFLFLFLSLSGSFEANIYSVALFSSQARKISFASERHLKSIHVPRCLNVRNSVCFI